MFFSMAVSYFKQANKLTAHVGALLLAVTATSFSIPALAEGTRVLANMPQAENLIITSDNRLFVGAQDGLYFVPRNGSPATKIPVAFSLTATPSTSNACYFFGLAQVGRYVYAACSPSPAMADSPRYLLMMDLAASSLSVRAFHVEKNANFFNGLAADSLGNLYVAVSPLAFGGGKIVKFALSSPGVVKSRIDWLKSDNKVNGIKIYRSTLYFTEDRFDLLVIASGLVRKTAILSDGSAGTPTTIYTTWPGAGLDDLMLVNGGVVVTTTDVSLPLSPNNRIVHVSEAGQLLHISSIFTPFLLPSSVALVQGANGTVMYVTERGNAVLPIAGHVSEYVQNWNLNPRL